MANKKETIRITKLLNNIYNNPKFLSDLCSLCNNNYNSVLFAFGDILEYYITSRDLRQLTAEEMNVVVGLFKYIGVNKDYKIFNINNNESPNDALRRNIIHNGYMTRSINSYFLNKISKYGLGSIKNIDNKLNKIFDELEGYFGKNNYSVVDTLEHNQFCLSTPGANSFYQAGSNSPKRFFLGILGQKEIEMLPVLVGESKLDYYLRVLDKKVSSLSLDKKVSKKVLKLGKKALKLLCDDPKILLIPIKSNLYSIKVVKEKNVNYNIMPITDWIFLKLMDESPIKLFARDFGAANEDLGNIISYDTIIPYKEIGVLNVPDRFKIIQAIAKNKGYKKNTKISYITAGEIVDNKEQ